MISAAGLQSGPCSKYADVSWLLPFFWPAGYDWPVALARFRFRLHVFDRQPQSWADGPGAGTFLHTVSPTNTKEKRKRVVKGMQNRFPYDKVRKPR